MEQQDADTLDLRDYLSVLRRRQWIVLQVIVVVVAVAMAITVTRTPMYSATTALVVEPNAGSGDDAVLQTLVFGQRELETQRELVTSRPVATMAAGQLEGEQDLEALVDTLTVSLVRDTQILEIEAVSPEPAQAARVAEAFASAYLDYRREQALDQVVRASEALQERESEARRRLDQLESQIAAAEEGDVEALEVERDRLAAEVAALGAQQLSLRGSEVLARGGGQIIRPAVVPDEPFSPRPLRTGILALVLGGMLGVGLAFLRDFMDDAIRSDDQVKRATGRPVLGYVPRWAPGAKGETRLVSLIEPASPVAESYRALRTNVRFLSVERERNSLLVTSPLPGEGKTTTAGNLAVALARSGTRVLLVGSDLRKPTVHRAFGISAQPGLSDVLIGEAEYKDAIVDVGVPNLRVIAGGQVPPNPAELLGSMAMKNVMTHLEQIADMVIYDGPPVLAVSDTLELGPNTGAALLVIDSGETGRHALGHAVERLRGVGTEIAGVVMNRIDPQDGYYGYSYYETYAAEQPQADAPTH